MRATIEQVLLVGCKLTEQPYLRRNLYGKARLELI